MAIVQVSPSFNVSIGTDVQGTPLPGDVPQMQLDGTTIAWSPAPPDVTAPPSTGVAATDTADLAAAIGDTPAGGWLHLPGNADGATPYTLNAALSLTKHIRITGRGVFEAHGAYGGGATDNPDCPIVAPYLYGTLLEQTAAATDCITIAQPGLVTQLENFGIIFAPAIRFANTGHGINVTPPADRTGLDQGIMNSTWRNLACFGVDGTHYAWHLNNPILCTFQHMRAYGGGGWFLACNSDRYNFGNSVLVHPYVCLFVRGTSHAYQLTCADANAAGKIINMVSLERPQANADDLHTVFAGVNPPQASQFLYIDTTNAAAKIPSYIRLNDPDFELISGAASGVSCGNLTFIREGFSAFAYAHRETMNYNLPANSGFQPTVAAGNGINPTGGGTVIIPGSPRCDDIVGVVEIAVGTTPPAAGQDCFTVTFAKQLPGVPRYVQAISRTDGWAQKLGFYASAISATAFTMRSPTQMPANQTFQVGWQVVW